MSICHPASVDQLLRATSGNNVPLRPAVSAHRRGSSSNTPTPIICLSLLRSFPILPLGRSPLRQRVLHNSLHLLYRRRLRRPYLKLSCSLLHKHLCPQNHV